MGTGERTPPHPSENLLLQSYLIFQWSIFSNNFPEIVGNSFVLWNYNQKNPKFSYNLPKTFCFVVQMRKRPKLVFHFLKNILKKWIFAIFLRLFWKFTKISQKFQNHCVFRPKPGKFNECILKNFEKYAKVISLLQFSWYFSKISQNFPTLCPYSLKERKRSASSLKNLWKLSWDYLQPSSSLSVP